MTAKHILDAIRQTAGDNSTDPAVVESLRGIVARAQRYEAIDKATEQISTSLNGSLQDFVGQYNSPEMRARITEEMAKLVASMLPNDIKVTAQSDLSDPSVIVVMMDRDGN